MITPTHTTHTPFTLAAIYHCCCKSVLFLLQIPVNHYIPYPLIIILQSDGYFAVLAFFAKDFLSSSSFSSSNNGNGLLK